MRLLWTVADFVRAMRRQMRFGQLSRAPLRLLRFELRGPAAECDWVARPADEWDAGLPERIGNGNASRQALQDAIAVRELLFDALPGIETALFRVFRQSVAGTLELIITGMVDREQEARRNTRSLAKQAKVLGFQFWLEDGTLECLESRESALSP